MKRIILTGGGTAGHVTPNIALLPRLKELGYDIHYIGSYTGIEKELIDVYRMNANFSGRVLFQVYLPLMGGYLKQAYVNAVGMGVKLAVSTEYLVQTKNSLGKAVYSSAYFNEYQDIYAYALVMILLVLVVSEGPVMIGRIAAKRKRT